MRAVPENTGNVPVAALAYLDELGYNKSYYGSELPPRPFWKG